MLLETYFRVRRLPDGRFETEGTPAADFGRQLRSTVHERPDGCWATWRWDGTSLAVETDRFGFFPLFYTVEDDAIAVSGSLCTLIEHGAARDIDATALGIFLSVGYFINETTPFASIRVAPPNGGITWDGTLTVRDGTPIYETETATYDEAVDLYIELFRDAMRRRIPDDDGFAIPISGGRDSRHMLLEACALGRPPRYAVTTAGKVGPGRLEVPPARAVCKAAGVEHVLIEPSPEFDVLWRQTVEQHFCADENGWMIGMVDHLRETVHTTYDGVAGDMFGVARVFNHEWQTALREGKCADLVWTTLLNRDIQAIAALLPEAYEGVGDEEAVHAALVAELQRFADTPNPGAGFTTFNRTRREIALGPYALMAGLDAHCPFMDHALFDRLSRIPYEVLWAGPYHDDVIAKAYPKHADLPYAGHAAARPNRGDQMRLTRQVLGHALRHDPTWRRRLPLLAAHWARAAAAPSYRQRHRWLSPPRLLYLTMLEQLRRDPHAFASPIARTASAVGG
jgi:hypothetical protein